ncbi:PHB depolymerase family esterase [Enterovirga sp.]|uniref:extracellular catalytic domain type 1 short-chain-length polyhydroxyalkanoate depolymerase n=1 Tax=Enterovirga sp. TaxID=2026350 RepID=UPI0026031FB3|nr:PHB depolymerase family esterase [Enterovirga sp.]MDB5590957.1 esterase, depolymerase family [Enterovirga sp.]
MPGLQATALDLSQLRRKWRGLMEGGPAAERSPGQRASDGQLRPVPQFGSNPGELEMFDFAPAGLSRSPALVVVLHGCNQDAAGYAVGAGWVTLAERHGFVLVCPQQRSVNNAKSCFNWFVPEDTRRDGGEVESIRQMVDHAVAAYGVDPRRIFVTGLSAGGAMAAAMLASYPEMFAAGGIVSGLPYGAAGNVQQALHAMFQGQGREATEWGDRVRAAASHEGPWPRLSVWHGSSDRVVVPGNATELVKQWSDLHGLPTRPSGRERVGIHLREVWRDRAGAEVIESYTVDGLGHGTPLATSPGEESCGEAGPFLLEAGISSSYRMAVFWGLVQESAAARANRVPDVDIIPPGEAGPLPRGRDASGFGHGLAAELPGDVGAVITKALRAAGLMRR